jgi:hypothetical protein
MAREAGEIAIPGMSGWDGGVEEEGGTLEFIGGVKEGAGLCAELGGSRSGRGRLDVGTRLKGEAMLIILKVFSEEIVGCKLRSSEPCGCTLTLRDRFLWLSVLVRVGAERWGQRERERGRGGGGTWGKVRKEDELVGECEELVHLQRKCTRKGRE